MSARPFNGGEGKPRAAKGRRKEPHHDVGLHAVDSDMVEGASTAVPPTAMRSVWAVAPLVGDVISISGGWVSRRTVAVSWSVRPTASVACAIVSLSPSEFKGTPSATK